MFMSPAMFEKKLYATLLYVTPEKVYVTYLMSPMGDIRKKGGDIKKKPMGYGPIWTQSFQKMPLKKAFFKP